jgi:hypothetical protein
MEGWDTRVRDPNIFYSKCDLVSPVSSLEVGFRWYMQEALHEQCRGCIVETSFLVAEDTNSHFKMCTVVVLEGLIKKVGLIMTAWLCQISSKATTLISTMSPFPFC